MTKIPEDLVQALDVIDEAGVQKPTIALILGSGLGSLADEARHATEISTTALPGYPHSSVKGHEGKLVFGRLEDTDVVFVRGRAHLYEGHEPRKLGFYVRLIHQLGAKELLVTNAAGGINRHFEPGTLMYITDHINFAFANPLSGPNLPGGPRFPDMSEPYDESWISEAEDVALDIGVATTCGVYIWTRGPSYETKAEVRMMEKLGADAVGMSTVPEVIQARHLGMKVLGISTITNPAAGVGSEPLDHDDVLEVGKQVRGDLSRLVRGILKHRLSS